MNPPMRGHLNPHNLSACFNMYAAFPESHRVRSIDPLSCQSKARIQGRRRRGRSNKSCRLFPRSDSKTATGIRFSLSGKSRRSLNVTTPSGTDAAPVVRDPIRRDKTRQDRRCFSPDSGSIKTTFLSNSARERAIYFFSRRLAIN